MSECEVKKAELKEALVLKFDDINFGVIDLDEGPLILNVKVNGMGPATLQGVVYDPLSRQSEFVFTL